MDCTEIAPGLTLGAKPKTLADYEQIIKFNAVFEFNNSNEFTRKTLTHLDASRADIEDMERVVKSLIWYHSALDDEQPTGAIPAYTNVIKPFSSYRAGRYNIYVHCKNGLHRSAHFLIFSLMLGGCTYDQAFNLIHAKRAIEVKPLLKQQLEDWYDRKQL